MASAPQRKSAFPPVITPAIRVLILGSLPGEASLAAARYYAHPTNQFWKLAGVVIGHPELPTIDYDTRLEMLTTAGIGLWDTVSSARRSGSLDTAIRSAEPAEILSLLPSLPQLRAIAFNGGTAAKVGERQLKSCSLPRIQLPSSSAAYAAMPLAEKAQHWCILQQFLD